MFYAFTFKEKTRKNSMHFYTKLQNVFSVLIKLD